MAGILCVIFFISAVSSKPLTPSSWTIDKGSSDNMNGITFFHSTDTSTSSNSDTDRVNIPQLQQYIPDQRKLFNFAGLSPFFRDTDRRSSEKQDFGRNLLTSGGTTTGSENPPSMFLPLTASNDRQEGASESMAPGSDFNNFKSMDEVDLPTASEVIDFSAFSSQISKTGSSNSVGDSVNSFAAPTSDSLNMNYDFSGLGLSSPDSNTETGATSNFNAMNSFSSDFSKIGKPSDSIGAVATNSFNAARDFGNDFSNLGRVSSGSDFGAGATNSFNAMNDFSKLGTSDSNSDLGRDSSNAFNVVSDFSGGLSGDINSGSNIVNNADATNNFNVVKDFSNGKSEKTFGGLHNGFNSFDKTDFTTDEQASNFGGINSNFGNRFDSNVQDTGFSNGGLSGSNGLLSKQPINPPKRGPSFSMKTKFNDHSRKPMFLVKSAFVDTSGRQNPNMKAVGGFVDNSKDVKTKQKPKELSTTILPTQDTTFGTKATTSSAPVNSDDVTVTKGIQNANTNIKNTNGNSNLKVDILYPPAPFPAQVQPTSNQIVDARGQSETSSGNNVASNPIKTQDTNVIDQSVSGSVNSNTMNQPITNQNTIVSDQSGAVSLDALNNVDTGRVDYDIYSDVQGSTNDATGEIVENQNGGSPTSGNRIPMKSEPEVIDVFKTETNVQVLNPNFHSNRNSQMNGQNQDTDGTGLSNQITGNSFAANTNQIATGAQNSNSQVMTGLSNNQVMQQNSNFRGIPQVSSGISQNGNRNTGLNPREFQNNNNRAINTNTFQNQNGVGSQFNNFQTTGNQNTPNQAGNQMTSLNNNIQTGNGFTRNQQNIGTLNNQQNVNQNQQRPLPNSNVLSTMQQNKNINANQITGSQLNGQMNGIPVTQQNGVPIVQNGVPIQQNGTPMQQLNGASVMNNLNGQMIQNGGQNQKVGNVNAGNNVSNSQNIVPQGNVPMINNGVSNTQQNMQNNMSPQNPQSNMVNSVNPANNRNQNLQNNNLQGNVIPQNNFGGGVNTQQGGVNTQQSVVNTQLGGVNTQRAGVNMQQGGVNTQQGRVNTQQGIANTQRAGVNTQQGGINSQMGGLNSQMGVVNSQMGAVNTQMGGGNVQQGGVNTQQGGVNKQFSGQNTQQTGLNTQRGIFNSQMGGVNAQQGGFNSQMGGVNNQQGVVNTQRAIGNNMVNGQQQQQFVQPNSQNMLNQQNNLVNNMNSFRNGQNANNFNQLTNFNRLNNVNSQGINGNFPQNGLNTVPQLPFGGNQMFNGQNIGPNFIPNGGMAIPQQNPFLSNGPQFNPNQIRLNSFNGGGFMPF